MSSGDVLVQDVESAGMFVLSLSVPSYSVRIFSEFCLEFCGDSMVHSIASNYRVVVNSPRMKPEVRSLDVALAEAHCLTVEQSSVALDLLRNYAREEARKALSNETSYVGFALGLSRKEDGALFVRELIMVRLRHQRFGWWYLAGFSKDITRDISVEQLLGATSREAYNCLIDRRTGIDSGLLTGILCGKQCFDEIAEDMWGATLLGGSLNRDWSQFKQNSSSPQKMSMSGASDLTHRASTAPPELPEMRSSGMENVDS